MGPRPTVPRGSRREIKRKEKSERRKKKKEKNGRNERNGEIQTIWARGEAREKKRRSIE